MTRFVVDLGDAKLSPQTKNTIAAAIQTAVIRELADVELPGSRPHAGFIPPTWLGFILRQEIEQLADANAENGLFANAPGTGG